MLDVMSSLAAIRECSDDNRVVGVEGAEEAAKAAWVVVGKNE